jgi:uncharacterized membrane protein YccC
VWDRLVSVDPGLARLQTAGRTTATMLIGLVVLALAAGAAGQPLSVAMPGLLVLFLCTTTLSEPDSERRTFTMLLLPVPAALALAVGVLLAPYWVLAEAGLVVVLSVGMYATRWGSRGAALGSAAAVVSFVPVLAPPDPGQLPWLLASLPVGAGCAVLVLLYLLPDRPERLLPRMLAGLRVRLRAVLAALDEPLRTGQLDLRDRRRLRARTARLSESTVLVQDQLDERTSRRGPGLDHEELLLAVVDLQLLAERLAAAGEQLAVPAVPGPVRAALRAEVSALHASLSGGWPPPGDAGDAPDDTSSAALLTIDAHRNHGQHQAARRMLVALRELATQVQQLRQSGVRPAVAAPAAPAPAEAVAPPHPASSAAASPSAGPADATPAHDSTAAAQRWSPSTRLAVQVGLATSLALVAGQLLSPTRWYWAVITALLVFVGAQSGGQVASKSWQRLLGTALGVPVGVLVATVIAGSAAWSVAVILLALFSMTYVTPVSAGLAALWLTVMLAVLYGLLGTFSTDLLLLRAAETAAGAAIGAGVALTVLPTRTSAAARVAAQDVLATLGQLVGSCARTLSEAPAAPALTAPPLTGHGRDQSSLYEQTATLQKQLQRLHRLVEPLTDGLTGLGKRSGAERAVRLLGAASHHARALARTVQRGVELEPEVLAVVRAAARGIEDDLADTAAMLDRPLPSGSDARQPAGSSAELLDAAEQAVLDRQRGTGRSRTAADSTPEALQVTRSLRLLDEAVGTLRPRPGRAGTGAPAGRGATGTPGSPS